MGIKQEAKERRVISLDQAIDLCSEYFEFDPIQVIELETGFGESGKEEFTVAFRSVWSPDQIEAMEALDEFIDKECEHEDVLERNLQTNEPLTHPTTGEALTQRVPKVPYKIDGEDIDPSYEHRYLTALWGDEDKARRAAQNGLTYGVVQMMLGRMNDQFNTWKRSREQRDPK